MRILVEPSDYPKLQNIGDMAAQYTAVTRLAEFWPEAEIAVLTDSPAELADYGPNVRGLSRECRQTWLAGCSPGLRRFVPLPRSVIRWEGRYRQHLPSTMEALIRIKNRIRGRDLRPLSAFLSAVREADLLIVCGMGGITDVFESYALDLLDTIAFVRANGKAVVAMFSQGMGPISPGTELAGRARAVLPTVDFIALREDLGGRPLLQRLGVNPERVMTTGDDAIEIAAQNRPSVPGSGLGINVRLAWYAQLTAALVPKLRAVLQQFVRAESAPLVALPVSLYQEQDDRSSIQQVAAGYERVIGDVQAVNDPWALSRQLALCRMVVTGSYHAAVFGLSQGVPAVCIENSPYYRDKFLGLKAQFGRGVEVVALSDADWPQRLELALRETWGRVENVRPNLIAAATRQIELSRQAYSRVRQLFAERMPTRATWRLDAAGGSAW